MNDLPPQIAVYAFLGFGVSLLLRPLNLSWTTIYPYLWYCHAILGIAFVAYLPFSKLLHILVSPLIVTINSVRNMETGE